MFFDSAISHCEAHILQLPAKVYICRWICKGRGRASDSVYRGNSELNLVAEGQAGEVVNEIQRSG